MPLNKETKPDRIVTVSPTFVNCENSNVITGCHWIMELWEFQIFSFLTITCYYKTLAYSPTIITEHLGFFKMQNYCSCPEEDELYEV